MTDNELEKICSQFRNAIEKARDDGSFDRDLSFGHFPDACCGDTSDLLARYLYDYGVKTIYVCGMRNIFSHAWLVVDDERVQAPKIVHNSVTDDIRALLSFYGNQQVDNEIEYTKWSCDDFRNDLILDLTGDQFKDYNKSVYVGTPDVFHLTFDIDFAQKWEPSPNARLSELYRIIIEHM